MIETIGKIFAVDVIDREAKLKLNNYAIQKLTEMNLDNPLRIKISEVRSQRSLEQNRFFWKIIGTCIDDDNSSFDDKMDLYIYLLQKVGIQAELNWFDINTLDDAKRLYRALKVVQKVDVMDDGNIKHLVICECYKGSSKFNTKEMSALIDEAIRYADEQGIENDFWNEWEMLK